MTTDLLADQDLAALVRVSRPEHALISTLQRPEPERFVARLPERGGHPYLQLFGWRHPVTIAELLRQLSVAVVRLSLPVHEHHDYALTGMRWRYPGVQAPRLPTQLGAGVLSTPGPLPTAVELRLGRRSERDGKLAKLALSATLFADDVVLCALELDGGFYPYAVLDGLMRRAVGDRVAPVPIYPPRSTALATTLGIEPDLLLIDEPETLADGARRTAIVASSEHPFFHHNVAPELRRHVPAVLLLEAALQLVRCLPATGERCIEEIVVALREYVAFNRLDTWLSAQEHQDPEGTRVIIGVQQGEAPVNKGSFELLLDQRR